MLKSKINFMEILSNYGMIIVLLLLCIFFSLATISVHYPEGEDAAVQVFDKITDIAGEKIQVLLLLKKSNDDDALSSSIQNLLQEGGFPRPMILQGSPVDIRKGLENITSSDKKIGIIVTSHSFRPVVKNLLRRADKLSSLPLISPEGFKWPTFLLRSNLMNVANQISVIAIIAVGMTMVIITAGIDLSVGSLIAFSSVVVTWIIGRLGGEGAGLVILLLSSLAAILACGVIGAFSGLLVTRYKLPPFIATLGMMQVASGLAYIISQGKPIYQIPQSYTWLGRGTSGLFMLPNAVILMILIYIAAEIIMSRTVLGRYIYAVGGNQEAARLSGVNVKKILIFVYIACGMLAGLGGIVMTSQLKSGAPTYGLLYELYVIAAVVVGGTSLSGGEGRIFGTLIGAFIIAVIQNGMNLTNVESYTQKVVLGLVILAAVLLDMLKKKHLVKKS